LRFATGQRDENDSRLTRLLNWVYDHEDSLAYVFDSVILTSVLQRLKNRLEEGS
jgi:Uma2 family endonuclease